MVALRVVPHGTQVAVVRNTNREPNCHIPLQLKLRSHWGQRLRAAAAWAMAALSALCRGRCPNELFGVAAAIGADGAWHANAYRLTAPGSHRTQCTLPGRLELPTLRLTASRSGQLS